MTWRIHHKAETASTNLDAREGVHGDVFTADYQTAGRGRLDHKWLSPKGANLMMSVVLSAEGLEPDQVATLPLVVGLAVARALNGQDARSTSGEAGDVERASRPFAMLKWPNDVLVNGKKIAGILCERHGDNVIAGIGVNVGQTEFDTEIADRATSLALNGQDARSTREGANGQDARSTREGANGQDARSTVKVRNAVLGQLGKWYGIWRAGGFAAVHPEIAAIDLLRGRTVSVRQADDDSSPVTGVSNGIMDDGSLDVGGTKVYAGEAHVENF